MDGDAKLARLLEHPAIWRGRGGAAHQRGLPTGFAALDAYLPGYGWPRTGLIEILVSRFGSGELYLLLPALAALTRAAAARWCVWVAPPLMPFAPALVSQGIVLDRVAVVSGARPLWALEQALGSGACDVALAWARQPKAREIRRLQLAAARGAGGFCCGFAPESAADHRRCAHHAFEGPGRHARCGRSLEARRLACLNSGRHGMRPHILRAAASRAGVALPADA